MYAQEGVSIQLLDYEFRTLNQEERAALAFTLRFINNAGVPVQVEFFRRDIAAVDNLNIQYYECTTSDSSRNDVVQIEIPEGSAEVELFLGLDTNYCPSRADIGTDYVDVKLGTIKVRTGHLIEFVNLAWRLVR